MSITPRTLVGTLSPLFDLSRGERSARPGVWQSKKPNGPPPEKCLAAPPFTAEKLGQESAEADA
jgi:hypothetical protein